MCCIHNAAGRTPWVGIMLGPGQCRFKDWQSVMRADGLMSYAQDKNWSQSLRNGPYKLYLNLNVLTGELLCESSHDLLAGLASSALRYQQS
jgi:hypothetical protein